MATLFCGEKAHQVDDKNRIRIPSCFRDSLGSDYVFGEGAIAGTIDILPRATLDKRLLAMYDSFNGDFFDEEQQELITDFAANFMSVSEDSQGRVVIPEELKKKAGINREVVTLGSIDHLVLMSAEKRAEQKATRSYSSTLKLIKEKMNQKKEQNV